MRKYWRNYSALIFCVLVLASTVPLNLIGPVSADIPAMTSWTGRGAMAHWKIVDTEHGNASITIDAVYGRDTIDGKSNMIYVKVVNQQGVSEATGYSANISSISWNDFIQGTVKLKCTLTFNWASSNNPHLVTITWYATGPSVANYITWKNGTTTFALGYW